MASGATACVPRGLLLPATATASTFIQSAARQGIWLACTATMLTTLHSPVPTRRLIDGLCMRPGENGAPYPFLRMVRVCSPEGPLLWRAPSQLRALARRRFASFIPVLMAPSTALSATAVAPAMVVSFTSGCARDPFVVRRPSGTNLSYRVQTYEVPFFHRFARP